MVDTCLPIEAILCDLVERWGAVSHCLAVLAGNLDLDQLNCQTLLPDIVLTDIEMPLMTGLELASALAEENLLCKVIIVTTFARTGYLRRALGAGVRGYLLKDAPADTLAQAIRTVQAGGRAIAPR